MKLFLSTITKSELKWIFEASVSTINFLFKSVNIPSVCNILEGVYLAQNPWLLHTLNFSWMCWITWRKCVWYAQNCIISHPNSTCLCLLNDLTPTATATVNCKLSQILSVSKCDWHIFQSRSVQKQGPCSPLGYWVTYCYHGDIFWHPYHRLIFT